MQGITLLHLCGNYIIRIHIKQSGFNGFFRTSNGFFWGTLHLCQSCRYHASEIFGTSVTRIESAGSWHLQILLPSTTRRFNLNTNDFSHFLFTNFEGVWISQSNNISQASGESKFFFAKRRGECNVSHTFISYA